MNRKTNLQIQTLLDNCDLFPGNNSQIATSNFDFNSEIILITGAAGSIGSELTRQLVNSNFKLLILVDNAESPLYYLEKELEFKTKQNIDFVLADIREQDAMNWLFETYKPTMVFHAAAYKHVPLMEENAYEAVRLNILATKIVADLAVKFRVKKFVFISTDKAVKPISVMGMTKRLAEGYLKYLDANHLTDFKSTRFGNIFGSNGSVLPVFLKQINSGNPITITSYNTSRYFINKSRASHLILKIADFKKQEGYLFTFNMGKPIKIIDLAKALIKHVAEDKKHHIELIGLRPGEKVHEDMVSNTEDLELTKYSDILKVKSNYSYSGEKASFNLLSMVNPNMSNSEIKTILKNFIEKLQSSPSLLFAI